MVIRFMITWRSWLGSAKVVGSPSGSSRVISVFFEMLTSKSSAISRTTSETAIADIERGPWPLYASIWWTISLARRAASRAWSSERRTPAWAGWEPSSSVASSTLPSMTWSRLLKS
ncbi:MAG: hypothetical protein DYH12_16155 [Sorangiineae bacterium PRO1]|nr:hypothetical protein [Sorangiineae bacterium PRO1]